MPCSHAAAYSASARSSSRSRGARSCWMPNAAASCSTCRAGASTPRRASTRTTGRRWPIPPGHAKSKTTTACARIDRASRPTGLLALPLFLRDVGLGRQKSGSAQAQYGKNFASARSNLLMSHVLIVDDDANTREALAVLADQEGFTTALAGSVAEARIHLVRQRPDVILMDLKLPDGSGIDLMEDLEDRSSIETILITGHASVESAVEALRLGASDYLTKPVNLQRLKAVLSRVPKSGELRAEIGQMRDELRH